MCIRDRCSERGELQLTASGISGIPVFQISRYATRALADEKHPYVPVSYTHLLVIVRKKKFTVFAIYCLLVGALSIGGYFYLA